MPVHLNAFVPEQKQNEVLVNLLCSDSFDRYDRVYQSEDGKYLHTSLTLTDLRDNTEVGNVVYTMKIGEKAIEIIDIDITLKSSEPVELRFEKRYPWSSDSNEYYFAMTEHSEQAAEVETVNRYVVHQDILNTVQPVFISAFPFRVEIFDNIEDASKAYGFDHPVNVPALGDNFTVSLFSDTFSAPGSMFRKEDSEDCFSFLFGTVRKIRPTEFQVGQEIVRFLIVNIETAFGVIPAAMSEEVFDLKKLKPGVILVMRADIKADLSAAASEREYEEGREIT